MTSKLEVSQQLSSPISCRNYSFETKAVSFPTFGFKLAFLLYLVDVFISDSATSLVIVEAWLSVDFHLEELRHLPKYGLVWAGTLGAFSLMT